MARMQSRCGEAAGVAESLSNSEKGSEKGQGSMVECMIGTGRLERLRIRSTKESGNGALAKRAWPQRDE